MDWSSWTVNNHIRCLLALVLIVWGYLIDPDLIYIKWECKNAKYKLD